MSTDLLETPIRTLELSHALRHALITNNINTMKELISHPTKDIQRWPGMDIQLVHECVNYLIEKGYGQFIDQKTQGSAHPETKSKSYI